MKFPLRKTKMKTIMRLCLNLFICVFSVVVASVVFVALKWKDVYEKITYKRFEEIKESSTKAGVKVT